MPKAFLIAALLISGSSVAFAAKPTPEQEKACKSDATRHCRKEMKIGDDAVLQCLKDAREKISAGCRKVLEESGN